MSCPICGSGTQQTHRPFCSKRCADLDLVEWLNGGYAIPSSDPEDIENALKEVEKVEKGSAGDLPPPH